MRKEEEECRGVTARGRGGYTSWTWLVVEDVDELDDVGVAEALEDGDLAVDVVLGR